MPSIFQVKKAACFAADGKVRSLKPGDLIEDTDPIFPALDRTTLMKVRETPPEPAAVEAPARPEPVPEPTPHTELYRKSQEKPEKPEKPEKKGRR